MIVVMGLYRGGSSAVAGVLYHLGVCMGHEIKCIPARAKETEPYVCWEDWEMRRACLKCYTEPGLEPKANFVARVQHLKMWLSGRRAEHFNRPPQPSQRGRADALFIPYGLCGHPDGVKYPMLCAMGPECEAAFGEGVQYVKVERDPEIVGESLRRWFGSEAPALTRKLHDARERFLAGRPHVRVEYDRLCAEPAGEVERLARELGLNPSNDQFEDAAAFVHRPEGVTA